MSEFFDSSFFAGNRERLRQMFTGTAPIVMTANGLLQRGGDSSFAFAQDASFWHLTGVDEPDILLVMDRDKEYLVVPERSVTREAFDGAVDGGELTEISGIKQVYSGREGWDMLSARLRKVKHVATLASAPAYIEQYGLYSNPARTTLAAKIKECNPDIELLDLSPHIARLRMIKQPKEIEALQQAIDITEAAIREATRATKLQSYAYEYELEAELTKGFRKRGASGHSFDPIVAGGASAVVLHNVANNSQLDANDLVVMDVGAEFNHYAADITRTRYLGTGTPSKRQRAVHAAVLDVQTYAFSLLGPGTVLKDYEKQIEQYMGEKLRELGLIKIIDSANVREFYPHATSHFLGLNVHDVGDYERPLEAGSVITVEPGIYIKNEKIGVRIEDDVLITTDGIKILSDKLTRDL